MNDLTEFLLARIGEDEWAATTMDRKGPWRVDGPTASRKSRLYDVPTQRDVATGGRVDMDYLARHDPARVLAECEAKRRIVALHAIRVEREWENPVDGPACQVEERYCVICGWVPDACDTVKTLAAVYSDHPDYRRVVS